MINYIRYNRPYPQATDRAMTTPACRARPAGENLDSVRPDELGWICCRLKKHEGAHEACGPSGQTYASWEDDPS